MGRRRWTIIPEGWEAGRAGGEEGSWEGWGKCSLVFILCQGC